MTKMKKAFSLLILTSLCAIATGCGVKGPLYFPEKAEGNTTVENQSAQ